MVEYLPKWHRIDDLLHLVQFVGIRRPNYQRNLPIQLFGSMFRRWRLVPL